MLKFHECGGIPNQTRRFQPSIPISLAQPFFRVTHIACYRAQRHSTDHQPMESSRSCVGSQETAEAAVVIPEHTDIVQNPLNCSSFYFRAPHKEKKKKKTCKLEKNYFLFMNNPLFWPLCFVVSTCSRVIQRHALALMYNLKSTITGIYWKGIPCFHGY